ncbi:MAG: aspartate aminotransferase [Bacteroidetes bacterium]|nr:MAG: aspartate aminotransferase [Bacteroidota bacterium]
MPKISSKAATMPASPIRKLVPFANAAKERGVKVYHLNIGQPDIETPECALNAIKNNDLKVLAYSDSSGLMSYRKGLVEYYKGVGINIEISDLIVTQSGSEALFFALMTTLDPGDEIIIPEPYYANYNGIAAEVGINIIAVPSSIDEGFALPPIAEFEKLITPKTKAIMVCNPNNPTGYLYSQEEIESLGKIALKHDLFLIADEVYREFCYDGHKHFSVMELPGLENNTILVDSVSKRYSMCGVRIGAIVSRNKELMKGVLQFAMARLCAPAYGQLAAEAALETPQEYFDTVYNEYIARRDFMVNALNKMEGVFTPMPKGAFYTVVKLPVDDANKFAQWMLEEFSMDNSTVMIAPAEGFYGTPGKGRNEARMAYVLNIKDLEKAMKVFEAGLKAYPGRTL